MEHVLFAQSMRIAYQINWDMVLDVLVTGFTVARTRYTGYTRARASVAGTPTQCRCTRATAAAGKETDCNIPI